MSLRIHDNTAAQQVQRSLTLGMQKTSLATERLASGYRINNAGDDGAGSHISTNLSADVRGTRQAIENVQDGINFLQIAEGVYGQVTDMTQRIRELLVQAANDTYGANERQAIADEIGQLVTEIENTYDSAYFGGKKIFDSSASTTWLIQVGSKSDDVVDLYDTGNLNMPGFASPGHMWYDVAQISTTLTSGDAARTAIDNLDSTMAVLNRRHAYLGKMQNSLEAIHQNLMVELENTAHANSRIQDTDVAHESLNLVQGQIQQNAASALLSQAASQNAQIALGLMGAA